MDMTMYCYYQYSSGEESKIFDLVRLVEKVGVYSYYMPPTGSLGLVYGLMSKNMQGKWLVDVKWVNGNGNKNFTVVRTDLLELVKRNGENWLTWI